MVACVAADGTFLPPLIVYERGAVQSRWTSTDAYPGILYAASSNGWMEEPQFYYWFTTAFIPHAQNCRVKHQLPHQTAVLIFDGHASHVRLRLVEEAVKCNVHLVRLPSHLTDRLQPLDKCVLKLNCNRGLWTDGQRGMSFAELLGQVWAVALTSKNIKCGFLTTGIFPVDSKRFSEDLFDPADFQWYKCSLHN